MLMFLSLVLMFFCMFFFSSRRRHTRSDRDWSSDVCSSDLQLRNLPAGEGDDALATARLIQDLSDLGDRFKSFMLAHETEPQRSEERRVGKECRSGWSADH